MICVNLKLLYMCIFKWPTEFQMVSTTSLLQGMKYMIITLDIKTIIIELEMLELFQITQSELMDQYFGIHSITTLPRSNLIKHSKNQYKTNLICHYKKVFGAMECIV